jgi:PadR family transcriptional regulator PadR
MHEQMEVGSMNIKDNLKRGTIEMILLSLLQQEDKYGYQLSKDLEEQSGGEYLLNEATMYPTLYRLKKNGYLEEKKVQVVGKRFRVYYHLTAEGQSYLEETLHEYRSVCSAIDKVLKYQPQPRD